MLIGYQWHNMSLSHSAKVVTDGLVFYYDMGNTQKSWKGAPTFNASLLDGQNGVTPWGGDGAPAISIIDPDVKFRGRKVAKYRAGTSGNCYINGPGDLSTGTTSTVWTSTFYLKRVDGTALSSVGMYQYVTNNTNVNLSVNVTAVEDGWYKAVYTRSGLVAGYPSLTGMYSLGASVDYYFADWQCENKAVSSPWVSGTRSNAQAIVDLVGNNTISLTGTNFGYGESSITIQNVNDSYIEAVTPTSFRMGTQNFSIGIWVKQLDNSANIIIESRGTDLIGYLFPLNYPSVGKMSLFINAAGAQSIYSSTNATLNSGVIQYIVATVNRSLGILTFYLNGQLFDTISGVQAATISPISGDIYRIGYDKGGSTTNMEVYSYQHYIKELSASEVSQNFNAHRGRYGI